MSVQILKNCVDGKMLYAQWSNIMFDIIKHKKVRSRDLIPDVKSINVKGQQYWIVIQSCYNDDFLIWIDKVKDRNNCFKFNFFIKKSISDEINDIVYSLKIDNEKKIIK